MAKPRRAGTDRVKVAVTATEERLLGRAAALADRYRLPWYRDHVEAVPFWLVLTPERLVLVESGTSDRPLAVDFGSAVLRRRLPGGRVREALVRAVGASTGVRVVADATAGMGSDAFVLASWGFRVHLIERVPAVAALLEDGVSRARATASLQTVASRMTLHVGDARELLEALPERPDVVYLDPMYPSTGKTALKNKAMQRFRALIGDDLDAGSLLEVARGVAARRVVVKRPRRAPVVAAAPSGALVGRTTRYDLYAPRPRERA